MQPVPSNSSGVYIGDLIDDGKDDIKPKRAYESTDDGDSTQIDGSQRAPLPEKRRADKSESSSESEEEVGEKSPKTILDVSSSGNAKDTTDDFYTDPANRVALMSEKDIREIKDPTVLQNLLIGCQNIAISCMSKTKEMTNKVEDFRSKTQIVLRDNMMRLASGNTAINQLNRTDIARIHRANVINTVARVSSFAITVLLGVLTIVCIFL